MTMNWHPHVLEGYAVAKTKCIVSETEGAFKRPPGNSNSAKKEVKNIDVLNCQVRRNR